MVDVAAAIDEEAVPVTLRTRADGSYDSGGNWVEGAATETAAFAALQPVSGRILQDLPEGIRNTVSLVGWSRSPVAVSNEIVYGQDTFRVVHVWPRPGDGFYKFALGGKA